MILFFYDRSKNAQEWLTRERILLETFVGTASGHTERAGKSGFRSFSGSHSSGIVFVGPLARTTTSKARPGRVKQDARCPTRQHRARHVRTARHASTTRGAPPQAVVVPGSGSEVASHGQWWYRTTLLLWRADDERRHSTCGVASDAPWRAHPLRAQAEPARRPRILLSCRAHGAPAPGRGFYISPCVIAEHTPTATGVALVPGFRTASRRTTVLRAGATSEEHPQLLFACACTRGATVSGNNWSAASSSVHGSCTAQAPPPAPAPELTCGPRATFLWHDVHATCVFSRWVRNGGREAGRWSAAYAAIGASVRAASSNLSAPTRRGDPSSGADRDICVQGKFDSAAGTADHSSFSFHPPDRLFLGGGGTHLHVSKDVTCKETAARKSASF
ncbi:hypothetical protein DFH08DRAFT_935633 [Mycena albidolilacea]|uniref:Uncharacterized protein n=1 Tax=Mycena albidolilacea TaxID=1033008 RepID=A0AAD7ESR0_9AGAR|nr:hypothetical protein DFH08DRAFT_935633 [Mycena albidolilacea]